MVLDAESNIMRYQNIDCLYFYTIGLSPQCNYYKHRCQCLYFRVFTNWASSQYFFSYLDIFGAYLVRSWAYYSLIGSTYVLSHQLFIPIINKISPNVASQLYYTYHSLIPATYITVMILILYNSLPILTYSSPHSLIHSILLYPKTLF